MSTGRDISFFFNPRSIAVVGASPTPDKPSHIILESLRRIDFQGDIYPVNPNYSHIDGIQCYSSLAEIKYDIDVAIFVLPAQKVIEALKDPRIKLKGAIIVSAGFKEVEEAGERLEKELKDIIDRRGIRIIGPNCLGIFDTVSRIDTFFVPENRVKRPPRGGLSILTQSGSFAVMIMNDMESENIGVARIVSYGNKVDVSEVDCLEFLADDEATKVIAIYMESVDDGRKFVDVASRITKRKPVIVKKVGKRDTGIRAARSHTGAISGKYEIYKAAFKKAGIIEADEYDGLKDACRVLDAYEMVAGNRVLIVTDGGGVGVSLADACEDIGLDVLPLSKNARKRLISRVSCISATHNPIDLTGSVRDVDYAAVLHEGLSDGYDVVIVSVLWAPPKITEGVIDKLKEVKDTFNIPMIISSPSGEYSRKMAKIFKENGLPVFYTPESAVRAAAVLAGLDI